MTNEQRAVLDLAEDWFEAQEDGMPCESLVEDHSLYQAIATMRSRATPIPYVPSTPVAAEVLEQAATELDRQKRDGWRLVFKVVDGRAGRYLETGS